MAVTLKDVAQRAGVSTSAVSRAFTDGASVSDKMRRRVLQAARELGYRPNVLASSLTTGRTRMIGLISNNFHNPLFLTVFDQFTRALQERGMRPLLANLSGAVVPDDYVQMMRSYSVDGVIVASSTLPPAFALAFQSADIPVVHTFGRYTTSPDVHVVGIDNVACGRMAAQALLDRGHRKVGFLGGPAEATSTQDREAGFLAHLGQVPQVQTSVSYAAAYSFDAGRAEMQRLLQNDPAEAYFCGDDVLSIGALSALQDAGYRVPDDIGLIGLNDMEMAGWANIDLTTIRQPIAEIILGSVDLMMKLLKEPCHAPEARLYPCEIIERGTLSPVRTAEPPDGR